MASLKVNLLEMKIASAKTSLPQDLGDGLILRLATLDDAEPLAQLSGRVFGRDQFDQVAADYTRMYVESHPVVGVSNVFVVEDTRERKLVSTMLLIPQTWTYMGIPFGVGRPEMVATDPDYRRRGLVRKQFDALHHISEAMGHQVQGITGIPWFYRQFDYEYALDLGGGKILPLDAIPALKENESEPYRLRAMVLDDIPFAMELYEHDCARSHIACPWDKSFWEYHINVPQNSYTKLPIQIIETADGRAVGYVFLTRDLSQRMYYEVFALAVVPGQSLRAAMPAVLRAVKTLALAEGVTQQKEIRGIYFSLGRTHPAFDAMPELPTTTRAPYGWYIRVPDVVGFINHIAPALELELSLSPLTGHTGEIKVSEYRRGFRIIIENGKVRAETWTPIEHETDAGFPPFVFLQLLFGKNSMSELHECFPDAWGKDEAKVLLGTLFPKRYSCVTPIG
jgi:ribosomal protein S18 acetylase RimI-like enzyme